MKSEIEDSLALRRCSLSSPSFSGSPLPTWCSRSTRGRRKEGLRPRALPEKGRGHHFPFSFFFFRRTPPFFSCARVLSGGTTDTRGLGNEENVQFWSAFSPSPSSPFFPYFFPPIFPSSAPLGRGGRSDGTSSRSASAGRAVPPPFFFQKLRPLPLPVAEQKGGNPPGRKKN